MCYGPEVDRFLGAAGLSLRALRDPRAAARAVSRRPLRRSLRLFRQVPVGPRRTVTVPLERFARRRLRRFGDHTLIGPLWIVMRRLGERPIDLTGWESTLTVPTLARMAQAGYVVGAHLTVVDRLLDLVPTSYDLVDPGLVGLRGKVDQRVGRFGDALTRFERAASLQPGHPGWSRRVSRVRGQLLMSDPSWRPDLHVLRPVPISERHRGRVLHLLSNSLPHRQVGYTVRAQNVARCQQAVGLDPRMVTRAGFPGNAGVFHAPPSEVVDGVEYRRILPDLARDTPVDELALATAVGLAALVEELRPVVIQPTTDYLNAQVALAVAERYDLPVIYEVRGFLEETWRSKVDGGPTDVDRYTRAKAIETDCMRRATGIVTLSETMRADILGRGGIDPERVAVVPNAVDVERFRPGVRDAALAAELGIAPNETVVGYISSFTAYEGIAYLIRAVALLRDEGRPVRLLLVGDGAERANLEAVAAEVGVSQDRGVIFTGLVPHDDIERYYRTIDIFVVPRTNDRVSQLVTPLKPYEAMAMGKALVVSAVPALLEIVQDGVTGRSAPPEDAAVLAERIGALIDDPAQREELGRAAREWVTEHRTWTANGRRYLDFYRRLDLA